MRKMAGVMANRDYNPGDLIYIEESFVQAVPRSKKDIICEWCLKGSLFLKTCTRCSTVKYCGRQCQKNDWSTHKLECLHLKNIPKTGQVDLLRLLGKLILAVKDKDWKTISRNVLGTEVTFDDIDTHHKSMTEIPLLQLLFTELKESTEIYIGKENMPSDENLLKLIGKLKFHYMTEAQLCFYIGPFLFDHECIPNANAIPYGRSMKIWAIKKIRKGIDKISIPARQILGSPFLEIFAFDKTSCMCTDCSLPYGESVLSKIVDKKRAFSVITETDSMLNLTAISPFHLCDPFIKAAIDRILQKQEGVLGNTNYHHLSLLALKCLKTNSCPTIIKQPLMDLEEHMRSIFGELYYEMAHVYDALAAVHLKLRNFAEVAAYTRKAGIIKRYYQLS